MNVLSQTSDRLANNAMTTSKSIRIAVIGDQRAIREAVVRMLKSADGIEVVGQGATTADALQIAQELVPDIMLLDLHLRERAIEAVASIARMYPDVRTVILTASEDEQDVALALQAGARGYIMTDSSGREVVETVRAVIRGGSRAAPKLAPRLLIKNGEHIKTVVNDNLYELAPREQ